MPAFATDRSASRRCYVSRASHNFLGDKFEMQFLFGISRYQKEIYQRGSILAQPVFLVELKHVSLYWKCPRQVIASTRS
jgi:hypothetical protein